VNEELTVSKLVKTMGERLSLSSATGPHIEGGAIGDSNVSMPGLLLAGYSDGFRSERVQILGCAEVSYLASLDDDARAEALGRLCAAPVPCVIVSDGLEPPEPLVELGNSRDVPVFTTPLTSDRIARELVSQLEDLLAPHEIIHGTLVDVHGVGLLFTGKSGIGKSECGLDLVANGHRLVADDMVCVMRTRRDYLIGIDVQAMFGTRAFRQRKRIEVEVKLAAWSDLTDYARLGFEEETSEILGVEIPAVTLPLVLGKNITVISEIVALNYLLKLRGINAAKVFDKRQREAIRRQAGLLRATRGDDE
jgi:HPr kinase/phosphorylase